MALTGNSFFRLFRKLRMGGDGVSVRTLTGALSLTVLEEQLCAYDPGGASRNVTIHVDDNVVGNMRMFYNSADADGENLVIKNSAGTTIMTIGRGETGVCVYGGSTPAWVKMLVTDGTADVFAAANSWGGTQTFQNAILGPVSTLTIATGAVAATRSYHQLDTEGAAASDDLDDITGGAEGEVLLVRIVAAARNVVLKHAIGANKIACPGGRDLTLDVLTDWALLVHNGTQWTVLAFDTLTDGFLAATSAWTGSQTFQNLLVGAASELTIATGAVAATRSYHTIDTEADAASDDLDDITGGATGEILVIRPESGARTVVLRHAIGANKIACPGGRNLSLAEPTDWALLVHDGTQWAVIGSNLLSDAVTAIVAENTDVVIPVSHADAVTVSGTWTRSRTAQGLYRIRRTAAAASEVLALEIPVARLRSTASRGLKVTGAKIQYQISTEAADDVTVAGVYVVMPADAAAVAAATSLGAVTYDAGHDTAGERGGIAQHTMTVTFGTPAYLTDGFITLEITVNDTTGGGAVFDLFLVELLASETLVEAA